MKTTRNPAEVQAAREAKKRQRELQQHIDSMRYALRNATTNHAVANASVYLLASEAKAERERRMASDLEWAAFYSQQLRKEDGGAFSRFMAAALNPIPELHD